MALTATQKVLTLDYWKPADKVQVGDYIFNKDGKPTKVKLVQLYRSEECYEVEFNDHLTVEGDKHLGFLVEDKKYRDRLLQYKGIQKKFRRPLKFTKIQDFLGLSLKDKRSRSVYSIPTTQPIQFPYQLPSIPPFIFGFWFFNKRARTKYISQPGLSEYIYQKFKDHGYQIKEGRKNNRGRYFTVTPSLESQLAPDIPNRIPANYLFGSVEERVELLSGIMYAKTRQYSQTTDMFRFGTKHYGTAKRVQNLVESLGSKTVLQYDESVKTYKLFFKSRLQLMEHQKSPKIKVHLSRRYIKKINPIPAQMCVHIETEGKDNSILVGEGFIQAC